MVAVALGLLQTYMILQFLLPEADYALMKAVLAYTSSIGIFQNLGLSSGLTRQVAQAKNNTKVFKLFLTSVTIRYIVAIPIALFMFFASTALATNGFNVETMPFLLRELFSTDFFGSFISGYNDPQFVLPLQLCAIYVVLDSPISMLNSVLTGVQKFNKLFVYQAVKAVVDFAITIPAIIFFGVTGYFYALILVTLFSLITLCYLVFSSINIKSSFALPSFKDVQVLLIEIFSIAFVLYIVKIFSTNWMNFGPRVLTQDIGTILAAPFILSFTYSRLLLHASDSITDINLPVFSKKFENENFDKFKKDFKANFNKIFAFIMFSGSSGSILAPLLITVIFPNRIDSFSLPVIPALVFAFVMYSLLDIVKSTLMVPSNLRAILLVTFATLLGFHSWFYFSLSSIFGAELAMSYGLLVSIGLAFLVSIAASGYKLKFSFFTVRHLLLLLMCATFSFYTFDIAQPLGWLRILVQYVVFLIFYIGIVFGLRIASFKDLEPFVNKVKKLVVRF